MTDRMTEEMQRRLDLLNGHQEDLCRQVWQILFPAFDEEGTVTALKALYDKVGHGIFPEGERPVLTEDEEMYISVLEGLFLQHVDSFDPLSDLREIPEESVKKSRTAKEYERFRQAVQEEHYMALMRIGREVMPFDLASHTIGVYNVVMHTAIQAYQAGFKVNLPLAGAAALCHDIGKIGCRGNDAKRVPYFHYYYTWQWFLDHDMEQIGHVSANHSTWDLEFENLPIESLLLIYGDFRVRGYRDENGKEHMTIYSLSEARDIIFSKLYNMTPEKKARYDTVYAKLRDFELLLQRYGVSPVIGEEYQGQPPVKDASLMTAEEALQGLREMSLEGSIRLMREISTDRKLESLLETAKGEKNLQRIRTYLLLFGEYNTYMTRANKQKTLLFLYELLMHPHGDVRRMAGNIMGEILANSGPKYRKERPEHAKESAIMPTMMALLSESVDLWKEYLDKIMVPDRGISSKHALRIVNCLKNITYSLFNSCDEKDAADLLQPLVDRLEKDQGDTFVLLDAIRQVPVHYLDKVPAKVYLDAINRVIGQAEDMDMMVMMAIRHLMTSTVLRPDLVEILKNYEANGFEHRNVLLYARDKMLVREPASMNSEEVRRIYLDNLKFSVHWTIKCEQMDMLCHHVLNHPWDRLRIAMHLANMLSVSEHLPAREAAGEYLLKVAEGLKEDQINEIVIDLTRELETGREQVSMFIAPYLGAMMSRLAEKEMAESVDQLEGLVGTGSLLHARVAMQTLGRLICELPEDAKEMRERLVGIIFTGICHYEDEIAGTALRVLCINILGNEKLSYEQRSDIFMSIHKKLLTILSDSKVVHLDIYNRSAMLNHLYRFIVEYQVKCGAFIYPVMKKAAFFPGTFDPFSVGHKQIVSYIRDMGYEVYLAVDEFSWRKKTLPKLLRRQIVAMSVADQKDTYLFADEIPINLAAPGDLKLLASLLPQKEVTIVCGSDVVCNASAYRLKDPDGAAYYDHIVFGREEGDEGRRRIEAILKGNVNYINLPSFFESVSSTRIRESVDMKLDISMLVAPTVQNLIYEKGLYIRESDDKQTFDRHDLSFRLYQGDWTNAPEVIAQSGESCREAMAAGLFRYGQELLGWTIGRSGSVDDLYDLFHDPEVASLVRRRASGKLLFIESINSMGHPSQELYRMVLNELLVRSLEGAHTYALCIASPEEEEKCAALRELGFQALEGRPDIFCVDMRAPVMLLQDAMSSVKKPHRFAASVVEAFSRSRLRLRAALNEMFPGQLLLSFDSEIINGALVERIVRMNAMEETPEDPKKLGPLMCVPYGRVLSDELVPYTVTKALHVEKCYEPYPAQFSIRETPNYSPLRNQVRALKSFHRPVILVDDFLHKSKRLLRMDEVFNEEEVQIACVLVGIMSGRGRDSMRRQNRQAECEYYIPNLRYWFSESALYPFIGGDGIEGRMVEEPLMPSLNMILPYCYPGYLNGVSEESVIDLSLAALEGAREIMAALEKTHQDNFNVTLTIGRLSEALRQPRVPDKGRSMIYNTALPATEYLKDDILQIRRISKFEV
ncbi:MAG: hypothetical protein KBS83_02070 [Lachnospiraceae bacterium]|nr:hypothetical protein [Candidatus Equihabitans merdae]